MLLPSIQDPQTSTLLCDVLEELVPHLYAQPEPNTDWERLTGKHHWLKLQEQLYVLMNRLLRPFRLIWLKPEELDNVQRFPRFKAFLSHLEPLYSMLQDDYSRRTLLRLVAHKVLGKHRVLLPLNTAHYHQQRKAYAQLADKTQFVDIAFRNWRLYLHHLQSVGYPIQLFGHFTGLHTTFGLKHYDYPHSQPAITAEPGDVVIDAGGCWGDTALYFAHAVGPSGQVYSFEFIPSNLKIFDQNLALNPQLAPQIHVVTHPLWSQSGQALYYRDDGPGSRVSFDASFGNSGSVHTVSIDDIVSQYNLARVDFIKMDIEGAELHALEGARQTLLRFKPKLAISIYHHLDDFYTIPQFLTALGVGYSYYLDHHTIHEYETVLYAQVMPD